MMAYRGRLIFPFLAELHQLDTEATAQDPDGAGPLTSGYDPDFREPIRIPQPGQQLGISARVEKAPIRLECQVEPGTFEAIQQLFSGNVPQGLMQLVFHYAELESRGLVDSASGDAMIRTGDRLGAIYDIKNNLVQEIRNPPGLYITEAKPIGFGLNSAHPHRNLLLVTLEDREQGARG